MAHYAITTNTCTVALAANAACSFGIQFAPTTPGTKTAAVQINATPGGTINMTLTGSAQPQAALSISPTQKDFGTGALTSATTTQDFTILNAAGAVPTGTLSFALPDTDFAIVGSTCPSVLAGGDSCTITVQLQPKVIAAYNTTVSVNATPGGTASATITGNGVSALTITPSGAFPNTAVGAESDITFTVTNAATAVQTGILSTSLAGTSFGQFGIVSDGCAGTHLATGGTCTIVARFVPTSVGAKTASLTVSETPGISTATANLSGTGGP
jgi:hypothetical protein